MSTYFLLQKNNPSTRAFTLIEFLIYFSILVGLVLVTGSVVFQVISSKTKLTTIQDVNQNARYIMEQLTNSIHNAQSITIPTVGQSSSSLSLVFTDSSKNPTVFDVVSGVLRVKEGNGNPIAIQADETVVTSLTFTNVSHPNTPGSVRIALIMSHSNPNSRPEDTHSETFYTTVTIRPK